MAANTKGGITAGQRSAVEGAGRTHSGILAAQDHLFAALGRPQPGREREWARAVGKRLEAARSAIADHRREVHGEDGLYRELREDAPWLLPRLTQLTSQLERIEREAADLAVEVHRVAEGDLGALPPIRREAEYMLISLRDLTSKETDLIYERFTDVAALD